MLFNSLTFLFLFLPITLIVFHVLARRANQSITILWLVAASLFFYAWWNPIYLGLILGSLLLNYLLGLAITSVQEKSTKKILLVIGIAGNLGTLGYFKYTNFFVDGLNSAFGAGFNLETIILPLAISFFTFEQVAYLVDTYKGVDRERSFIRYCMFVVFFPQLIAGPIVHHREMLPQLAAGWISRLNREQFTVGITIFIIGLFKKVAIADGLAPYATSVFTAADAGVELTIFQAWGGALAYTLQLYYDFSGYSDMAIGLALMFGIRLPLNFHSPYKAGNIIEFWNRWHMTLSRFLRDYLYIPLGGNRKGNGRRYLNVMITMLLGGLWHGASWTFVVWGALHGWYLIVNHAWRAFRVAQGHDLNNSSWFGRAMGRIITFAAVVVGWVFFRAETFSGAVIILKAMGGGNGISLPIRLFGKLGALEPWLVAHGIVKFNSMFPGGAFNAPALSIQGIFDGKVLGILLIAIVLLLAWFAPNPQQIMMRYNPALETYRGEIREWRGQWLQWRPSVAFGTWVGIMIFVSITFLLTSRPSEFLYFNF